jgi:hypothetical protein
MSVEPYATVEKDEETGEPWWHVRLYLDGSGPAFCQAKVRAANSTEASQRFRAWASEVIESSGLIVGEAK